MSAPTVNSVIATIPQPATNVARCCVVSENLANLVVMTFIRPYRDNQKDGFNVSVCKNRRVTFNLGHHTGVSGYRYALQ
mgnify:CR=1 FL=1